MKYALANGFVMTISGDASSSNLDELRQKYDEELRKKKRQKKKATELAAQLANSMVSFDCTEVCDVSDKSQRGCCSCGLWTAVRYVFYDAWVS